MEGAPTLVSVCKHQLIVNPTSQSLTISLGIQNLCLILAHIVLIINLEILLPTRALLPQHTFRRVPVRILNQLDRRRLFAHPLYLRLIGIQLKFASHLHFVESPLFMITGHLHLPAASK